MMNIEDIDVKIQLIYFSLGKLIYESEQTYSKQFQFNKINFGRLVLGDSDGSNDLQQLQRMGNEQAKQTQRNNRRRSLPVKNGNDQQTAYNRKNYNTINQSLQVASSVDPRQYNSLDYGQPPDDVKSIQSDRRKLKQDVDRDQILQKLSQKNEQLRRQLKKISDQLTEQIKRKKFVPKKKASAQDEEDAQEKAQANAGIRRELQNAYRQIQMYKRTLEALKGKNEEHESNNRVNKLENAVAEVDAGIGACMKKIEGAKKMKNVQDKVIQRDINEDIIGGVTTLKKEAEDIKNTLKDYAKRDRQRDVNYKRQQAYLFEVQKKYREMNGDYFPEIKKRALTNGANPAASRAVVSNQQGNKVTPEEYFSIQQEVNRLKYLHDEYNRKIDSKVQQKNKFLDEQAMLDENIRYSDKVIQALKKKLIQLKKIFRPTKKSLFGYDSYSGAELQSEYNGGVDEIQKQIQEQVNQDQFDIRHLIANIPKPSRPKVVIEFIEDANGKKVPVSQMQREVSGQKGGMVISGQKSQPKKWGSSLTRLQEKGRSIRKESVFDDVSHFQADAKPLIIGVNIWVNKNNAILGIQVIYLNGDEIRYGAKSSNAADGFLQRYDLQSPDYLKNITGSFSDQGYLEYLILFSKQGKVGTFGFKTDNQEPFNFGLAATERPFRLFGASFIFDAEPRINRIGIQICQQE